MATKLVRSYTLSNKKDIEGLAAAVERFFDTYDGTKVSKKKNTNGDYIVTCVTKSLWRKAVGYDVKITVSINKKGNCAEVHYRQNICETVRAIKAVFVSAAGIGVCKLYGAKERHEIPYKLNAAIGQYLSS